MRASPLVVALALFGLFGLSLVLGYLAGEVFLKPAVTVSPAGQPAPRASPTEVTPPGTPPAGGLTQPATPGRPSAAAPGPRPTTPGGGAPAATPRPVRTRTAPAPSPAAPVPAPTAMVASGQPSGPLYRVQAGAFLKRENADERAAQLKAAGFDAYVVPSGRLFKVQVGAFAERANAERLADQLRALGYETVIVYQ